MTSSYEDEDYPKSYFDPNVLMQKIGGVWSPPVKNKLYKMYSIFIIAYANIVFVICETLILNKTIQDATKLLRHLYILPQRYTADVKVAVMLYKRQQINEVIDILNSDQYKYESYKSFKPAEIVKKGMRNFKVVDRLFLYTCISVGLMSYFTTVPKINKMKPGESCEMDYLPFYSYTPFPSSTKEDCHWSLIFQTIPVTIIGIHIYLYDMLFDSILNCIETHFLVLGGAFRTIKQRCLVRLNFPHNLRLLHNNEIAILEQEMFNELLKCTKHLNMILNAVEKIENIFTYVNLTQCIVSLLTYASCLYKTANIPIFSSEFAVNIPYFSACTMQLSLYCWFGNKITLAAGNVNLAMYEAHWIGASPRFKKCMLINMCRMQKPVFLTVGKFTSLSLSTLLAIWRGSYSYFTVFNKKA